jgi:hypothetical protein
MVSIPIFLSAFLRFKSASCHCSNNVGRVSPVKITKGVGLIVYQVTLLPNFVGQQDLFHVFTLRFNDFIHMINSFRLGLYT